MRPWRRSDLVLLVVLLIVVLLAAAFLWVIWDEYRRG
jgi:hypothetical protein